MDSRLKIQIPARTIDEVQKRPKSGGIYTTRIHQKENKVRSPGNTVLSESQSSDSSKRHLREVTSMLNTPAILTQREKKHSTPLLVEKTQPGNQRNMMKSFKSYLAQQDYHPVTVHKSRPNPESPASHSGAYASPHSFLRHSGAALSSALGSDGTTGSPNFY